MNIPWLEETYIYLKNLIDINNFPNAVIITGNKSIGKNILAEEIAQYYLNYSNEENIVTQDYVKISVEEGSKAIKIDQIREVIDKIYFKSDRKIIYIKDADKLNINASNAILKILEEPPAGSKFILTTSKISSLLPTIISRSSIIKCNNPMDADINSYLSKLENVDLDNYYILSNLNSKYVKNNFYEKKFSIINDFFYDLDEVIHSSENIINFSKKFSVYNIEHIINIILFVVVNFQKSIITNKNSRFFDDNENILKAYNYKKLNYIYDKLISIKKNVNIIQNNETILFSICILFKRLSKAS